MSLQRLRSELSVIASQTKSRKVMVATPITDSVTTNFCAKLVAGWEDPVELIESDGVLDGIQFPLVSEVTVPVLLLVIAGDSRREDVKEAIGYLKKKGLPIAGTVLLERKGVLD